MSLVVNKRRQGTYKNACWIRNKLPPPAVGVIRYHTMQYFRLIVNINLYTTEEKIVSWQGLIATFNKEVKNEIS